MTTVSHPQNPSDEIPTSNQANFTTPLIQDDTGEFYVELPSDLVKVLKWYEGDLVEFDAIGRRIIIRKAGRGPEADGELP